MKNVLVLDIGGVLVFFDNHVMLSNLRSMMVHAPASTELLSEIRRSGIGTGAITVAALYDIFHSKYVIKGPREAFFAAWCSHFQPNTPLLDAITSLRADWDIVICSNTNDQHWRHLDATFGLRSRASHVVLSFECGVEKPNAEIFHIVRDSFKSRPPRTLFVDDDPLNVAGAIQEGFEGVLFENADTLLEFLEANE